MTCTNKQVELLMKNQSKNPNTSLNILASRSGMTPKTARKYLKAGKLPSELKEPRVHRTRLNPFDQHQALIQDMLTSAPGLQAKTILFYLMEQFPGIYQEPQ